MNDITKTVNHVREYRNQFKMTQAQLAEIMGISRQSIISIENGRYMPKLILAFEFAKIFHCIIEDIFVID